MALAWLTERGFDVKVRLYLDNPLSMLELNDLQRALRLPASEWMKGNEPEFQTLVGGKNLPNEQLLEILVLHPKLMQRPIVECGGRAVIARDLWVLESFNFQ
jgi:arsenate reductase